MTHRARSRWQHNKNHIEKTSISVHTSLPNIVFPLLPAAQALRQWSPSEPPNRKGSSHAPPKPLRQVQGSQRVQEKPSLPFTKVSLRFHCLTCLPRTVWHIEAEEPSGDVVQIFEAPGVLLHDPAGCAAHLLITGHDSLPQVSLPFFWHFFPRSSVSDKNSSYSFSRAFMETSTQSLCDAFIPSMETHSATKHTIFSILDWNSGLRRLLILIFVLCPESSRLGFFTTAGLFHFLDRISSRSLSTW